jgi:hypothetical protein
MIQSKKIFIISGVGIAGVLASWLTYRQFSTIGRIIRVAKKYIGQMEIQPNMGFVNKSFEKIMTTLGQWKPGFEWCACFARMVWLSVLNGRKHEIANRLLSPSSQLTFANFAADKSGFFEVSNKPKPGAIVIWQSVNEPGKGHAGIFISMFAGQYITVEGNTPKQNVGLRKYTPERMLRPSNVLKLRGFINIK